MEWRDRGIILATRRHGETSLIIDLFTQYHGRHLGLVRGGRSKRQQPVLQAGNAIDVTWRARLDEHLGVYQPELARSRAAELMSASERLYAFQTLAAHLRLFPERDPHEGVFAALENFLDGLDDEVLIIAARLVRLENELLAELGHGLDLTSCAATGTHHDLIYVSPKSGRAVSAEAGAPYADRLLALPAFLQSETAAPAASDVIAGAALTGYFLRRDLYQPRNLPMPPERDRLLAQLP